MISRWSSHVVVMRRHPRLAGSSITSMAFMLLPTILIFVIFLILLGLDIDDFSCQAHAFSAFIYFFALVNIFMKFLGYLFSREKRMSFLRSSPLRVVMATN